MRKHLASIKAAPGVDAGIAAVLQHGGTAAHEDPADESSDCQWAQLGTSVEEDFGGTPDYDDVRAMVRAYVVARMAATTEEWLEHVLTPPAGLFCLGVAKVMIRTRLNKQWPAPA